MVGPVLLESPVPFLQVLGLLFEVLIFAVSVPGAILQGFLFILVPSQPEMTLLSEQALEVVVWQYFWAIIDVV